MLASEYEARRADPFWSAVLAHCHDKLHLVPSIDMVLGRGIISVVLLEGDPDFLASSLALVPSSWPVLLLLPSGWSRPNLPQVQWLAVTHKQCGGVTTARVHVGRRGLSPLFFKLSSRRTIGSILIHSVRPEPCSPPSVSLSTYGSDDLLHTRQLDKPVKFATRFYKNGWGTRSLTPLELGAAFDLPLWIMQINDSFDWWIQHVLSPRFTPVKIPGQVLTTALPFLEPVLIHHLSTAGTKHGGPPSPLRPAKRGRWLSALAEHTQNGVLGTHIPSLPAFLPHAAWLDDSKISDIAVKSDDAVAPFWIWNGRIRGLFPWISDRALAGFRLLGLRWWRRRLYRSFIAYLRLRFGQAWPSLVSDSTLQGGDSDFSLHSAPLVRAAGCQVLSQLLASTWWDWDEGSSLIFWRWNGLDQQNEAWFGTPIHVTGALPSYHRKQRPPSDNMLAQVGAKLSTVLNRGYFDLNAPIASMSDYFAVPKGDSDIRMVYNGTSCGLNASLWAPNFWLPSSESALRLLTCDSYCGDMDLGEMFLNFPMDIRLRPFAGVDLTPLRDHLATPPSESKPKLARWNRLFMGMLPSPFHAARHYYIAEEMAKGSPQDPTNPCGFDAVRFNIPGSADYTPTLPWVMKWNSKLDNIAGDVVTYMDDLRTVGSSAEHVWQVARRLGSRLQYLGIQDAPRKRRPPSKTPGAWAGSVHHISESAVSKTLTQKKWDKGKALLKKYVEAFAESDAPIFDHKQMQRDVGFFVHQALTFSSMMPFLKGFCLTMNVWRPGRNGDGWKLSTREWISQLQEKLSDAEVNTLCGFLEEDEESEPSMQDTKETKVHSENPPKSVKAVPRLKSDVKALAAMLAEEEPPKVQVRSSSVYVALFGCGDASGCGFGAAFQLPQKKLSYRVGVWGRDIVVEESSNWKEFTNCVESLEEEATTGQLDSTEVFFFTDNSTVERCFYKGSSSSPKLLDLVIRLRRLEMKHALRLHISHVSGKRMIAVGVDGISRGQLNEGVMAGSPMLSYIPLHKTPIQMSDTLFEWVRSWLGAKTELLTPMDWFTTGHDIRGWTLPSDHNDLSLPILRPGHFVWAPPPGGADVALEELRKARHKRQSSMHVFLCQRLLTPKWFKQLHKACDLVLEIPAGTSFWPEGNFEPLIVGLVFPFIRSQPWQLRGTPKMFSMDRKLRKMWKEDPVGGRDLLRKFCVQCWKMRSMSERMVSRVLFFERR